MKPHTLTVRKQGEQQLAARQQELAESNAKLSAVLEAATQVSIVATDPKGLITLFNRGAEKMLGYNAEEMVGKKTSEILHVRSEVEASGKELSEKAGRPIVGFNILVEQARQDAHGEHEWTYVRKDGSRLTVSLGITALRDARGNIAGFVAVAKDITERKRSHEELESALQMKSDFVSFATHQLRTPLAGIKWLLELAAHAGNTSEETGSLVQDAREATERLVRMVNDLLDVSRLESGKLTLAPKDTNLWELTQSVLKDVGHEIETRRHELSTHGGEGIPAVHIDPQLFRQVILNLVSNAIKYTPAGGKIAIEMSQENGLVHWAIQDTGIGVPKSDQAHLFEKFYRAENVYGMETEGTGLGLYFVRVVLERSGGKVWFKSETGKGSTFTFELPAKGVT